jgi:hypothetical protein
LVRAKQLTIQTVPVRHKEEAMEVGRWFAVNLEIALGDHFGITEGQTPAATGMQLVSVDGEPISGVRIFDTRKEVCELVRELVSLQNQQTTLDKALREAPVGQEPSWASQGLQEVQPKLEVARQALQELTGEQVVGLAMELDSGQLRVTIGDTDWQGKAGLTLNVKKVRKVGRLYFPAGDKMVGDIVRYIIRGDELIIMAVCGTYRKQGQIQERAGELFLHFWHRPNRQGTDVLCYANADGTLKVQVKPLAYLQSESDATVQRDVANPAGLTATIGELAPGLKTVQAVVAEVETTAPVVPTTELPAVKAEKSARAEKLARDRAKNRAAGDDDAE